MLIPCSANVMRAAGRLVCAVALGLLVACSDTAPSTSDRSSPATAVASLANAIDQRDAAAVRNAFVAETPAQQRYVEAMAKLLTASRTLEQAARARFGREDAKMLVGTSGPESTTVRRFQDLTPSIEGDTATLTADAGEIMRLRKVGQEWRVIPSTDGKDADDEALDRASDAMEQLAATLERTAEQINNREVDSAADARRAILEQWLPGESRG